MRNLLVFVQIICFGLVSFNCVGVASAASYKSKWLAWYEKGVDTSWMSISEKDEIHPELKSIETNAARLAYGLAGLVGIGGSAFIYGAGYRPFAPAYACAPLLSLCAVRMFGLNELIASHRANNLIAKKEIEGEYRHYVNKYLALSAGKRVQPRSASEGDQHMLEVLSDDHAERGVKSQKKRIADLGYTKDGGAVKGLFYTHQTASNNCTDSTISNGFSTATQTPFQIFSAQLQKNHLRTGISALLGRAQYIPRLAEVTAHGVKSYKPFCARYLSK